MQAALPECDWVYFATPSKEDRVTTRTLVDEMGMIHRAIYNRVGIPTANTKQIQPGDTILLAYGGGRSRNPYSPVLSCTVIAPPRPVPGFDAFTFADGPQSERLRHSGYTIDPHLKRFTGISVGVLRSLERFDCSIPKPAGINVIRRWSEVFPTP